MGYIDDDYLENEVEKDLPEKCENCHDSFEEEVGLELLETGDTDIVNNEYSKEPFRIVECDDCEIRYLQRMNDGW